MASGCRPPPVRVYAEFIRCNGGATTRSRNAVVVKAGALWSACRSVRAFDHQRSVSGGRPWFSLDLAEKRLQNKLMGNIKGLVSLAESVNGIFSDSPSRAAGVPRRQQVREAQPEQPAEAAKPHRSEAHKERHLDLNSPHEWPSPKKRHLESACTSDAESDEDDEEYSPRKPSLRKESGHGYEDVLRGVVTRQYGQFAEVEQKLRTKRFDNMSRENEYVLERVKSNPPATLAGARQIEDFLTRQGECLLESLELMDKQDETERFALRWG